MLDKEGREIEGYSIWQVKCVDYADGTFGPGYALVDENANAVAITLKRAIEMQKEGYPFASIPICYPADFTSWVAPDFPQIGGNAPA